MAKGKQIRDEQGNKLYTFSFEKNGYNIELIHNRLKKTEYNMFFGQEQFANVEFNQDEYDKLKVKSEKVENLLVGCMRQGQIAWITWPELQLARECIAEAETIMYNTQMKKHLHSCR